MDAGGTRLPRVRGLQRPSGVLRSCRYKEGTGKGDDDVINADARSRITAEDLDLLGITLESDGVAREDLDRVLDRREVVGYLMGASLPAIARSASWRMPALS